MSDQDPKVPPLNADLAALLDAARHEPAPPDVAKQRVHAMILATVLPPLPQPGPDGGGAGPIIGGAGGAAAGGAGAGGAAAGGAAAGSAAIGGAALAPATKLALVAAVSTAMGVGAGVFYLNQTAPPPAVE